MHAHLIYSFTLRINFTLFANNQLSQIIIDYVNKNGFHHSLQIIDYVNKNSFHANN